MIIFKEYPSDAKFDVFHVNGRTLVISEIACTNF